MQPLAFAKQVVDSGALYFRGNPAVGERLKKITELSRNYLAHEYFNKDWRITAFSDMAATLDAAKLSFVASAHLIDHVDAVNLTAEGQKFLASVNHPILQQSVRDYFVNQQFRRDVFMKGPRQFTKLQNAEALLSEKFILTTPLEDVPRKVTGSVGEATLQDKVYEPIIAALAENKYSPKLLRDLATHQNVRPLQLGQVVQALVVLAGAGHVSLAQSFSKQTRAQCAALNRYLCERARWSAEIAFLASPVTGGGVLVQRLEQVFMLTQSPGKRSAQDLAKFAWDVLRQKGQMMKKDSKALQTEAENLEELAKLGEIFLKRLPILEALEIVQ